MLSVHSENQKPMTQRIFLTLLMLASILCTAGCMQPFTADNRIPNASVHPLPPASYKQTIAQPEDSAKFIKMDTDVYNLGEVVDFIITNEKTGDLTCARDPPSFSVRYQGGTGQWITRMGTENPVSGNPGKLKPGQSTAPYRFVTTGWATGRYRIVTDCGVSREILLRPIPSITPVGTPCSAATNTSPSIRVNAVSDQYAGELFTISGTTNLAAGEDLRYSIFAITSETGNITSAKLVSGTARVAEGSCGTNTWSVDGQILVPGNYFIGISNTANTVSAVRRFAVLVNVRPTATAILPVITTAPGISTG
jgi:hypothetical protein